MGGMPRAGVVDVPGGGAPTPAPPAKIAALADLLRRLAPDEVEPAVGFLVGEPRQGRIGVGWATLAKRLATHRGSAPPSGSGSGHGSSPESGPIRAENDATADRITVGELDRTLTELAG